MRRVRLLALLLLGLAAPAGAEKLVSTVSNPTVQITSSFDGAVLSLFGTIEPDDGRSRADGTLRCHRGHHRAAAVDRVARLKTNTWGIWTNTDQVTFKQFPSFYDVLASGKLDNIATPEVLAAQNVLPIQQATSTATLGEGSTKGAEFGTELVRLMTQEGHFAVREDAIRFLSNTAYVAQVTLPSDVANGAFIAHTYVLKDKQVVADRSEGLTVRKTGLENFVFVASKQQPLLYGLVCVALALGTGWLAGVAFKR